MLSVAIYKIYNEFAVGFEYNWKVKWLGIDLGFWSLELCWGDYA